MAAHFVSWGEVLNGDEPAQLVSQVSDRLQVRDLPVEEPVQVCQVGEVELEKLAIQAHILLVVQAILLPLHLTTAV